MKFNTNIDAVDDFVQSSRGKVRTSHKLCRTAIELHNPFCLVYVDHCNQIESRRPANESDIRRYKEQNAKLQNDLQIAKHEKEGYISKLESLVAEVDSLKSGVHDISRLRAKVDELQQVRL